MAGGVRGKNETQTETDRKDIQEMQYCNIPTART